MSYDEFMAKVEQLNGTEKEELAFECLDRLEYLLKDVELTRDSSKG